MNCFQINCEKYAYIINKNEINFLKFDREDLSIVCILKSGTHVVVTDASLEKLNNTWNEIHKLMTGN